MRHLSLAAEGERQPLMYYLARPVPPWGRWGEAWRRSQPQAELAVALTHAAEAESAAISTVLWKPCRPCASVIRGIAVLR